MLEEVGFSADGAHRQERLQDDGNLHLYIAQG